MAMQQVVASASQSSGSHSSSSSSGKELEGDAGGSSGLVSFFVDYSISRNFTDLEMMSLIGIHMCVCICMHSKYVLVFTCTQSVCKYYNAIVSYLIAGTPFDSIAMLFVVLHIVAS